MYGVWGTHGAYTVAKEGYSTDRTALGHLCDLYVILSWMSRQALRLRCDSVTCYRGSRERECVRERVSESVCVCGVYVKPTTSAVSPVHSTEYCTVVRRPSTRVPYRTEEDRPAKTDGRPSALPVPVVTSSRPASAPCAAPCTSSSRASSTCTSRAVYRFSVSPLRRSSPLHHAAEKPFPLVRTA